MMVASERRQITGLTDMDLHSICTSHVERNNLTIRTFIKRFNRRASEMQSVFSDVVERVANSAQLPCKKLIQKPI
ncbi:MAG: hypothetical protein ABSB33_02510 [Tepidisphaeraceae bacterium]